MGAERVLALGVERISCHQTRTSDLFITASARISKQPGNSVLSDVLENSRTTRSVELHSTSPGASAGRTPPPTSPRSAGKHRRSPHDDPSRQTKPKPPPPHLPAPWSTRSVELHSTPPGAQRRAHPAANLPAIHRKAPPPPRTTIHPGRGTRPDPRCRLCKGAPHAHEPHCRPCRGAPHAHEPRCRPCRQAPRVHEPRCRPCRGALHAHEPRCRPCRRALPAHGHRRRLPGWMHVLQRSICKGCIHPPTHERRRGNPCARLGTAEVPDRRPFRC